MKILVLNNGSSSIKCSLFTFSKTPTHFIEPIWQKTLEWKNTRADIVTSLQALLQGQTVDCIGHRIVHGGKKYTKSTLINEQVKKDIKDLASLAPLHNASDLVGIEIAEKLFPNKPQFAVFDTSFHHTLPATAAIYPGPAEWESMGIRRFGFHGISFQYCTERAVELLGHLPKKMVICHLGSGASLCALKDGKSIDTTMGFTPLEGLMMDTRSGTVDPGILLYLLQEQKMTPKELSHALYEKSGLLGLSGISSDMRDILREKDNPKAKLALEVYIHRLNSQIGAMIASLQGLDALVFTAGIGENVPLLWQQVCQCFAFLGLKLAATEAKPKDAIISTATSTLPVLVIHTQEAFQIAKECWKISPQR